jgi:hypothetical protein
MTKEQLQAKAERLEEENAALRELLAAIAEGRPPMYAVPGVANSDRWHSVRSERLGAVSGAAGEALKHAGTDGFIGALRAMVNYLRSEYAEPLGYEPEAPADDEWRLTPKSVEAADARRGEGGILLPADCDPDDAPEVTG